MEITDYDKEIGACIRNLRKREQFTQEELAYMAGYSNAYLSRLEKGHDSPSIRAAQDILNAMGYTITMEVKKWEE